MNGRPVEVLLGGLTIRVTSCGSDEETAAVVQSVNARLKELESSSHKVNTQAFALHAAYDFARELAGLRAQVKDEEAQTTQAVAGLMRQVEAFRERIAQTQHEAE